MITVIIDKESDGDQVVCPYCATYIIVACPTIPPAGVSLTICDHVVKLDRECGVIVFTSQDIKRREVVIDG